MQSDIYAAIPRLLRVPEVASILNISRSMAYYLVQMNEIPSVRLGSAVRVRPEDLQNYINAKLNYPTQE